jgi:translation initiation factor 6
MFKKLEFNGNPHIGIFCRANDEVAFVPHLKEKIKEEVGEALDVEVREISIGGGSIIGSLLAMNSNGAIATDFIGEEEKMIIQKFLELYILEDKFNAAGNNILANDRGALVHGGMKEKSIQKIEKVLDVPVYRGTIYGVETVGMAAVATNKGVLCHPKVGDQEKERLRSIFRVPVEIGTVSHGMPYIGAGLSANTRGAITSPSTTGIEMGRIEEALDL